MASSSNTGAAHSPAQKRAFCPSPRFSEQRTDNLLSYVLSPTRKNRPEYPVQSEAVLKLLSQMTLGEEHIAAVEKLKDEFNQHPELREYSNSMDAALIDCAYSPDRPGSAAQVASVLDAEGETLLSMPPEYYCGGGLDMSAKTTLVNKLWARQRDYLSDAERSALKKILSLVEERPAFGSWLLDRDSMKALLKSAIICSAASSSKWTCTNPILGEKACAVVKSKIFQLQMYHVTQEGILRIAALLKLLVGFSVNADEAKYLENLKKKLFQPNAYGLPNVPSSKSTQEGIVSGYVNAVKYVSPAVNVTCPTVLPGNQVQQAHVTRSTVLSENQGQQVHVARPTILPRNQVQQALVPRPTVVFQNQVHQDVPLEIQRMMTRWSQGVQTTSIIADTQALQGLLKGDVLNATDKRRMTLLATSILENKILEVQYSEPSQRAAVSQWLVRRVR